MKRKIASSLTALTVMASMFTYVPAADVSAAEEYKIRDKWGYCTTANYVESEHFVIFYGNNDTTGQVNEAFLKRNLEAYERLWKCYGEYLGMENMNIDIYGRSTQKYKTNVYLTYTGLDKYPDGWAFMSAEDGYGIEIISPEAMLDDLTIAHEFGHVVETHLLNNYNKSHPTEYQNALVNRYRWTNYKEKVYNDIRKDIIDIAMKNNKNFDITKQLSQYGMSSPAEFFAECFANMESGRPNQLGKAIKEYLKGVI